MTTLPNTLLQTRMIVGYHVPDNGRKYPVQIGMAFRGRNGNLTLSLVGSYKGPGGEEGGGQIQDSLNDRINEYIVPESDIVHLVEVWNRWHLNSMRAGCEHQRKMMASMIELGTVPDNFFRVSMYESVVALPGFAKCPTCKDGYEYGSAWLHETLDPEAVEFLLDLFDVNVSDRNAVNGFYHNEVKNSEMLKEVFG